MKKQRGFALLSPERRKEIASLGGKIGHQKGTAHKWNTKEAKAAARKMIIKRWPEKYANQKLDN